MLNKEIIMDVLNNYYKLVIDKYGSDRVAGIFAYGNVNYGIAEDVQEIYAVVAYVPDFEELCMREGFHNEKFNSKIIISDVRNEYNLLREQSQYFMEPMFTDYYILNPRYEESIMALRARAEDIFHYDTEQRIKYAVNQALDLLDKCEDLMKFKDKFEIKIRNYLATVARLDIAIDLYINNTPCEYCIKLKQDYCKRYLRDIKNGKATPDITELRGSLEESLRNVPKKKNPEIVSFVKARLLEIGKIAMSKGEDALKLLEQFTKTERQALLYIAREINCDQGIVSISKLIKEYDISRSTFTSVLNKLTNNNLITTENKGVKGLSVKIMDYTLKIALREETEMVNL